MQTNGIQQYLKFGLKKKRVSLMPMSSTSNTVIYTRVSTKEQAENNMSLETQLKACQKYAELKKRNVLGCFGGTYESAKSDERKEFKRMLDFVKKSKEQISYIIVYSMDRFSRSGANAIYIASELKKRGIAIESVSQPSDSNTPSGSLQQNIHFIFSEYDNQLRREKAMAGMKEKLNKGYWVSARPPGYDNVVVNGERKLVINEKGKLIRKAFEWKAKDQISNVEIQNRLIARKYFIPLQSLSRILKNPFYCGIMVHSMIEGGVMEGKHERLIPKELFLRVQDILSENHQKYSHEKESEPHPLRRFLKCGTCGTSFAGYLVKKKGLHYYKCAKKGCKCNKNANLIHSLFQEYLATFQIDRKYIQPLKLKLIQDYEALNKTDEENLKAVRSQITELSNKIETLEERHALGEITEELFKKFAGKYIEEKAKIEDGLPKNDIPTSNLEIYYKDALEMAVNLSKIWASGGYRTREQIQYLVFPEGIFYDREKGQLRTDRPNLVFAQIAELAKVLGANKKGWACKFASPSHVAGHMGFEPLM
ncbi:MAG: recombinase family protein [Bacteroidia bacterium]